MDPRWVFASRLLSPRRPLADLVGSRRRQETHTSTLLDYGAPVGSGAGPSSMAKLVGVPCGVSVQLILDGVITKKG